MTQAEFYRDCGSFEKLPYDVQMEHLNKFIEEDLKHWEDIRINGCSDPFWEDGVNMNLVRNHIIAWVHRQNELKNSERQLTMFDFIMAEGIMPDTVLDGRIPPMVADDYMAKDRPMAKQRRK